jgi:outer membrane lipoprotein-sorting protein
MRTVRVLSVGVGVLSVGLTGCFSSTRVVQKVLPPEMYRTASVQTLEKEVSDRDDSIKTLNASVLITASTGGGKEGKVTTYTSFKGYISVRKPRDLRVILALPVIGSRALDMVSDGKTFKLLIPPRNKAIVGTNEVTKPSKNGLENLRPAVFFDSLLVPGVADDEFVTLTESTRVLQPETKHKDAVEEPDYDLSVLRKVSNNIMRLGRVVHISRVNMLPFQQDIYDDKGQVVTTATYDKYQEASGVQFPTVIVISRPLDEYTLKVEVTKLTMNDTLPDDQFQLEIPPGVQVQTMQD